MLGYQCLASLFPSVVGTNPSLVPVTLPDTAPSSSGPSPRRPPRGGAPKPQDRDDGHRRDNPALTNAGVRLYAQTIHRAFSRGGAGPAAGVREPGGIHALSRSPDDC